MIGFLAVILLLAAGFLTFREISSRRVEKQLAAIRAAGLPTSPEELNYWQKKVPDANNQALAFLDAADVIVNPAKGADPNAKSLGSLNAGQNLSTNMQAAIDAYLADNRQALQAAHEAAKLTESHYPVNFSRGLATLVPHLAKVKNLTQLLRVEAIDHSRRGNTNEALQALATGFALASSLEKEPMLISDLVRIANVSLVLSALERVLSEHQLSDEQLAFLNQKVIETERIGTEAFHRALAGERALAASAFQLSFAQIEMLGSNDQPYDGNGGNEIGRNIGFQLYRISGLRQLDLSFYLKMMGGLVNNAKLEFPDRLRELGKIESEMESSFAGGRHRFAIVSRMLLPALSGAARKEAILAARLRYARVALAVERYRLDHQGALPDTLEQLSPKYLNTLPVDPFDGAVVLYERSPGVGYRVTSDGANAGPSHQSKKPEELTFTIYR